VRNISMEISMALRKEGGTTEDALNRCFLPTHLRLLLLSF